MVHNLITDEKCNTFVLAYELLVGAMRYKKLNTDIYWLLYNGEENIEKNKKILGNKTSNYFKNIHEKIKNSGTFNDGYKLYKSICLGDIIDGRIMETIYWLYKDEKINNKYYSDLGISKKREIDIIKKYIELEKILNEKIYKTH